MLNIACRKLLVFFSLVTLGCVSFSGRAEPIPINLIVVDGPGEGYNDPVLGPARLAAMQYTANLWGSFFEKTFPTQAVDVRVSIDPIPNVGTVDLLGISSSPRGVIPPARELQTTVSH